MSDDLLNEATGALKELGDAPANASELTRARVMRDLHREQRRRVSRTLILVPAAAILLGATAAAATTGGLSGAWRAVVSVVSGERIGGDEEATSSTAAPHARRNAAAETHSAAPAETASPTEPAPEPAASAMEASTEPVAEPTPAAEKPTTGGEQAASPKGQGQALPSAPAANGTASQTAANGALSQAEALELSLYRKAHQAHFNAHDFGAALLAWNDYIRRAPRGRFAAEAQYNRGICLVRLGRSAEAERALRPFAEGRYGEYRRDEAKRLIEALRGDAASAAPSSGN